MNSSSALALPVVQPERCCQPGQCAYTPGRVRALLSVMRHLQQFGEDVSEAADSALGSKGEGGVRGAAAGSGLAHHAARVWDVQQAQAAIGGRPSAEAIGGWLCPYSAEDEEGANS